MKRAFIAALVMLSCSGCSHDLLFGLFSGFYSDGGDNYWEKQRHFNERVEAWEGYNP